jgi:hypothetical protein
MIRVLDPNERRRQRDRERYASMPREKDELNMRRHERCMENKGRSPENTSLVSRDEVTKVPFI